MVINFENEVLPLRDRQLFQDEGSKQYFRYWCGINDHIVPEFVSRDEWNQLKKQGKALQREGESIIISVPEDLEYWEMFDLIRLIDVDTFKGTDTAKDHREHLRELISSFRDTGIYLKTYLEHSDWEENDEEKQMAEQLALDFYQFSRWAQFRSKRQVSYDQVPTVMLDNPELKEAMEPALRQVEELLLGEKLVRKRYQRLEDKLGRVPTSTEIDSERARILQLFIRAISRVEHAETSFEKPVPLRERAEQDKSWNEYVQLYLDKDEGQLSPEQLAHRDSLRDKFSVEKPWQRFGPSFSLQQSSYLGLNRFYSSPKRELDAAVQRRGKEMLTKDFMEAPVEMRAERSFDFVKRLGIDFSRERKRLMDKVNADRLRSELNEIRKTGDTDRITEKELQIVDLIQEEISKYEYQEGVSLPIDIQALEKINCVGATLLSSILFESIGIKYLEASVQKHSMVVVVTADGQAHYRDMRYKSLNTVISESEIGSNQLENLTEYVAKPSERSLDLEVNPEWYRKIIFGNDFIVPFLTLYHPKQGISSGVVNNLLWFLSEDVYKNKESINTLIALLEEQVAIFPNDSSILFSLASAYIDVGEYDLAKLILYRMQTVQKIETPTTFTLWAEIFYEEGKLELALESYRNALLLYPKNKSAWGIMIDILEDLGREGELRMTIEQAIEVTGSNVFKKRMIDLLIEQDDYEEALDIFEEIIDQYPEDVDLWANYHKTLFFYEPSQGNCRSVLETFKKLGYENGMGEIIKYAKQENAGEDWPQILEQEFLNKD
jgi:tetratricopeptide (TPR) repeat protein